MEQIIEIAGFIIDSFIHIWPYLVITIPIAVYVNLSGASKYIKSALSKKPVVSIFLATLVGAISPFCSCGVIPVIASLLIGGIPLAPVMSFWIASPSMDPEIFFLSTATIGWKLSIWRLVATFIISLSSGYIIHISITRGWLGQPILRKDLITAKHRPLIIPLKKTLAGIQDYFSRGRPPERVKVQMITHSSPEEQTLVSCCVAVEDPDLKSEIKTDPGKATCCDSTCPSPTVSFKKRLADETLKAIYLVVKFMTLAFFINALIHFYMPQESLSNLMSADGIPSVIIASFIGVPFYSSNITALPLVSGLLEMGLNEGAALAFLVSGPMTTLPAMAAVWGLVHRRIFISYISFALIGSIIFGILINLVN